jgi:enoyl-CoA hydratase/carnithine racemase
VQGQLSRTPANDSPTTPFPDLAAGARYLHLDNAGKRNALSVAVLRNLRDQLHASNRSPVDGQARYLPPFEPGILAELEKAFYHPDSEAGSAYGWLVHANEWQRHRSGLPRVIVLRSDGPVFCSGHDLNEIHRMSHAEAKALFDLCAEVMSLIRRCPVPVIGAIQGLATAAGAQLALTTDLPVAHASTPFRLPGSSMGFPCISPVTAVSRNVGNAFAYEMFTLSKTYRADELPGRPLQVVDDNVPLDQAVSEMVAYYTQRTAAQPHAFGKWAYWTQVGMHAKTSTADGYGDAAAWAGTAMALLAQTSDAKEGIGAFLAKRQPSWLT